MTLYDQLAPYRFPKTHEFVVNECRVLDVREVVFWLDTVHPQALAHSTVRVTGFIESYHDKTLREAAECPECDGGGCPDCKYTGYHPAYFELARVRRDLVLVRRASGATSRWYLLCPTCNRRCEHLYLLPGDHEYREPNDSLYAPKRGDWRCRNCWDLNYAAQQYGRRRASRAPLAPRRALSCRRRSQQASRLRARGSERLRERHEIIVTQAL